MNASQRVLYVEDEEDYQLLVRRILGRAGLEVDTADTGAEGLRKLAECRPALLILDINLPDTDGYAICAQLRQDPAWMDLPVLMLTVRRRPEEWLRGFSSGANDYISKPLNPPELVERVVNCLEGKSANFRPDSAPEYHLIQAAVRGNRAAFEVLIQKYRPRLIDNISQVVHDTGESEEVAARAFARAFTNLRAFRGEASFYTWLYRIAMNETAQLHRPEAVSIEKLAEGDDTALPGELVQDRSLSDDLQARDQSRRLYEALSRVPPAYRRMLEMYYLKDRSYDQIAAALGIPEGTVMSRMFKARRLLKEAYQRPPCAAGSAETPAKSRP